MLDCGLTQPGVLHGRLRCAVKKLPRIERAHRHTHRFLHQCWRLDAGVRFLGFFGTAGRMRTRTSYQPAWIARVGMCGLAPVSPIDYWIGVPRWRPEPTPRLPQSVCRPGHAGVIVAAAPRHRRCLESSWWVGRGRFARHMTYCLKGRIFQLSASVQTLLGEGDELADELRRELLLAVDQRKIPDQARRKWNSAEQAQPDLLEDSGT